MGLPVTFLGVMFLGRPQRSVGRILKDGFVIKLSKKLRIIRIDIGGLTPHGGGFLTKAKDSYRRSGEVATTISPMDSRR